MQDSGFKHVHSDNFSKIFRAEVHMTGEDTLKDLLDYTFATYGGNPDYEVHMRPGGWAFVLKRVKHNENSTAAATQHSRK